MLTILLLTAFYTFGSFSISNDVAPPHPIYIGVVEIEHIGESERATVLVKVFSDDLMNCVRSETAYEDLKSEEQICREFPFLISDYFDEHFTIHFGDEQAELVLKDCTHITDSHWLAFEINCPPQWNEITINADFFMEIFATQSNMITIINQGRRSFFRTSKGYEEFRAALN